MLIGDDSAVQTLVKEKVCPRLDRFPWRELARFEVGAETAVMFGRFLEAVQVVALFSTTGFAVGLEEFFEFVEEVGAGAEVGKLFAFRNCLCHGLLHGAPLVAVVAIPFDDRRRDALTVKDVLESPFDGAGSCARGTSDGHNRVTFRHRRRKRKTGIDFGRSSALCPLPA